MKLGIIVVYLINDENVDLFKLHLKQIAQYTTSPYHIFGSVNRLSSKYKSLVESIPEIVAIQCPQCPDTSQPIRGELSFNLEYLIEKALNTDVTHLVTMHMDSFPIAKGWEKSLANRLSCENVFITLFPECYSACLFWEKSFSLTYSPKLLITSEEEESSHYQSFMANYQDYNLGNVGNGFLYTAHNNQLSWSCLYSQHGLIFGDSIFHLSGATWLANKEFGKFGNHGAQTKGKRYKLIIGFFNKAKSVFGKLVPATLEDKIKNSFIPAQYSKLVTSKREELDRLLLAPEKYIETCKEYEAYLADQDKKISD